MKRLVIVFVIAALFACCSSSPLDMAISKVEKTIEKVEKNKSNLSEADWQALNTELEEPLRIINEGMEQDNVGAMKKIRLFTVAARWAALLMEAGVFEIENITSDWEKELEKVGKELEKLTEEL